MRICLRILRHTDIAAAADIAVDIALRYSAAADTDRAADTAAGTAAAAPAVHRDPVAACGYCCHMDTAAAADSCRRILLRILLRILRRPAPGCCCCGGGRRRRVVVVVVVLREGGRRREEEERGACGASWPPIWSSLEELSRASAVDGEPGRASATAANSARPIAARGAAAPTAQPQPDGIVVLVTGVARTPWSSGVSKLPVLCASWWKLAQSMRPVALAAGVPGVEPAVARGHAQLELAVAVHVADGGAWRRSSRR